MKAIKIACIMVLCSAVWSSAALASGYYDGVWSTSTGDYLTLNTNGSAILAITLDDTGEYTWEAYIGNPYGSAYRFTTAYGYVDAVFDVYFTSPTTAYAYQRSCVPRIGSYCQFRNGFRFDLYKIW